MANLNWPEAMICAEAFQFEIWRSFVYLLLTSSNQMGINGLLQLMKPGLKEKKLSEYRGKTGAVDTYSWLHKIIKGPSGLFLVKGGKDKYKFVQDILRRIDKIKSLGIKLIMVFDGGALPRKKDEEEARQKRREENYQKARDLLDSGDQEGYKKMAESIDISPDMAFLLIEKLRERNIDFIVAPYEADAQLAYLCRSRIADFILTEDSDMLAFGSPEVLYKYDNTNLTVQSVELDKIKDMRELSFGWFSHCMFLTTCILSGCDYLGQLQGIGIKRANKLILANKTFKNFLEEMNRDIVPENYEENFMKAFLTFRFQRVYCPRKKACVEVNPMIFEAEPRCHGDNKPWTEEVLNEEVLEWVKRHDLNFDFLGPKIDDELARRVAEGELHPVTYKEYERDDLSYLQYKGPIVGGDQSLLMTMNPFKPKNKPGERGKYSQESSQMQAFLQKKDEPKRMNFFNKPNYKPLQLNNDNSEDDNESLHSASLESLGEMNISKKESKRRILRFQNEDSESNELNESKSSHSNEEPSRSFSADLSEFEFHQQTKFAKEKASKPIEITDEDVHFTLTKPKKKQQNSVYNSQGSFFKQDFLKEIDEASEFKQFSHFKRFSSQKNHEELAEGKMERSPKTADTEQNSDDRADDRSESVDGKSDQKNPFFVIAESIKPMFGDQFYKQAFKEVLQ